MLSTKSLEYSEVFIALLRDVQTLHSNVFTTSDLRKTIKQVRSRISSEGLGFLTKSLPHLGKCLDKALAGTTLFDASKLAFRCQPNSQLPMLFGELFRCVLSTDGAPLPDASVACVQSLRDLLYVFYKLELPYDPKLEQKVISRFVKTEDEIKPYSASFRRIADSIDEAQKHYANGTCRDSSFIVSRVPLSTELSLPAWQRKTIRNARIELNKLFAGFDHLDIYPRHGPGAVSTRERLADKYTWTKVSGRITQTYPLDAYFHASLGHVCDTLQGAYSRIEEGESLASMVLVPKDSRGPRAISLEPLDFQWIQQGLSRAIVRHVERHPLTSESVRFTNQEPNRFAALYGSLSGKYATLDLNEASDRVSLGLVHLLFPEPVKTALLNCRSLGTVLPDNKELMLEKFAPMGSALCFPVLALTVWSLLKAGFKALNADRDVIRSIYVYGDDVIVPTAWAEHAMTVLETFGLKINRDKSCTKGFFRESCGMDAYKGVCVTPVRIRTPWESSRCPESYVSWISYANSIWDKKYYECYDYIVSQLLAIYGPIPERAYDDLSSSVPSLRSVPHQAPLLRTRWNERFQTRQFYVYAVKPVSVNIELIDGWKMLLRYFSEACSSHYMASSSLPEPANRPRRRDAFGLLNSPRSEWHSSAIEMIADDEFNSPSFRVRVYTKPRCIKLQRVWQ